MGHEELKRAFAVAIAGAVYEDLQNPDRNGMSGNVAALVVEVWDIADSLAAGAELRRCVQCKQMRNVQMYGTCKPCNDENNKKYLSIK